MANLGGSGDGVLWGAWVSFLLDFVFGGENGLNHAQWNLHFRGALLSMSTAPCSVGLELWWHGQNLRHHPCKA